MNNPLTEELPQRGGVAAVLGAADKISATTAALAEIRELAEYWRWSGTEGNAPKAPPLRQSGLSILGILERHGL